MIKIITTNKDNKVEFTIQDFEALIAELQNDAYQTGYNDAKKEHICNCKNHNANNDEASHSTQDENSYEGVTNDGVKFSVNKKETPEFNSRTIHIKHDEPFSFETLNQLINEVIK